MPPAATSAEELGAFGYPLLGSESTLVLAASRGAPPPEVLDQIAVAGAIDVRLREGGHHLRFTDAEDGGRTTIELHDRDGNAVRVLSTAEALDLAAGKPLA